MQCLIKYPDESLKSLLTEYDNKLGIPSRSSSSSRVVTASDVSRILTGILSGETNFDGQLPATVLLHDIDALCASFDAVKDAFNPDRSEQSRAPGFLHCFAVKSCPLAFVLHRAVQCGMGLETASIGEFLRTQQY